MSPMQIKLALYGAAALVAWWLTKKPTPPTAGVELGVGTVNGVYGADVYWSERRPNITGPAGSTNNPAVDPVMRDLIDRSNAAIAADDTLIGVD